MNLGQLMGLLRGCCSEGGPYSIALERLGIPVPLYQKYQWIAMKVVRRGDRKCLPSVALEMVMEGGFILCQIGASLAKAYSRSNSE